jgi:hypothetical protein
MKELGGVERRARAGDRGWIFGTDPNRMWMMTGGYWISDAGFECIGASAEMARAYRYRMAEHYWPKGITISLHKGTGIFYPVDFGHMSYFENYMHCDLYKCIRELPDFDPEYCMDGFKYGCLEEWEEGKRTGWLSFFHVCWTGMRLMGPSWSDYQVWEDRFYREFNPYGLAQPPHPFGPERINERLGWPFPEVKAAIEKAKTG